MIAGERDINRLVGLHRQEAGVSAENAAFRVINFLDELRAEKFIDFRLPPGDEGAPFWMSGFSRRRASSSLNRA
jgi:hypothetical protein